MDEKMVYTIMKHDIIAVNERATMKQAEDLMRTKRIRHLPVMNSEGRIVGILSDRDFRHVKTAMTVNDFERTVGSGENHLVKTYMNYPVLEARASDSIEKVVKRMLNSKVSCFLVVDEFTAPCGIVTTDDLLRYLADVIEKRDLEVSAPVGTIFKFLSTPTYE